MYNFFEGKLRSKSPTKIVVAAGGVGYELVIPLSTFQQLPDVGSEVHILAHFHVTEQQQQLFGFSSDKERSLFRLLISISGVGPKIALSVLSGLGADEFRRAVISGDVETLKGISGVGRKTAERLVIELREKIMLDGAVSAKTVSDFSPKLMTLEQDTIAALLQLGYRRLEAMEAVKKAFEKMDGKKEPRVEEIVRLSLKMI